MTSTAKIIIAVVVVAVLGAGLYYWYTTNYGMANDGSALPSGTSTNDAALEQDLTTINANVNAANSDSAAADASVNAASTGY
jgi:hypothetical protein